MPRHVFARPAIEILPATTAQEERTVGEVTELVNEVYATAEAGLWVEGATRTSTDEMAGMIAAGEIAVARVDGRIVGCARIQELDDRVSEFGLLAAHPARRGEGIGRELVTFAERASGLHGSAVMQLELLTPCDWSHPSKEFLHAWYTRAGYRPVRTGRIDEAYPHLAPLLATPCDFVVYHKPLVANGSAGRGPSSAQR
jgi:GNAT superfamily N-acetyltransferase